MADRKTFFTGINFRISRKILYFAFIDFLADSNLIFSLFHSAFSPKGNKIRISTFEKNKLMRNKYYYKISLWFSWFPFWHCRFCWNKILLVPDILFKSNGWQNSSVFHNSTGLISENGSRRGRFLYPNFIASIYLMFLRLFWYF